MNNKMIELKNEILKNKGLTINKELKNANLKNGFMVSIMGYEFTSYNIDDIMNKMIEYKDIIKDKNNYYIGVWIDTENKNLIYLDISKNIKKSRDAITEAKRNYQKAIYNIKDNKSIYLNYNITYYTLYKKIYKIIDNKKILIDEVFKNMYNKISDINSNYRIDKENYTIYKDIININEL